MRNPPTGPHPGDVLEIGIDGLSQDGRGVGRSDGLVVFADGLVPGDRARVRVTRASARLAEAVPVRLLAASPDRAAPFCPVFGRCGGCALQHLSYGAQLREKRRVVVDALARIGGVADAERIVAPTVGMARPFGYRAKVQIPVSGTAARPRIGFYARGSHDVVDAAECRVQHPAGDAARAAVRAWMEARAVPPYDERRHAGLLRHVVVRVGRATGDVMVGLVANGSELPDVPGLVARLRAAVEGAEGGGPEDAEGGGPSSAPSSAVSPRLRLASVYLDVNRARTNVVQGGDVRILHGAPWIEERLSGLRFRISPLSFFQVNPEQTEALYAAAVEAAGLTGRETAYDLYCGTGTIALFLARKAARVVGIESVAPAVEDAKANAAENGISNVDFIAGEAEAVVPERYARGERADVVVVDPPRKGCDARLLRTVADMRPARVVYVSCDPATMARDIAALAADGYRVEAATPVDMFPWTAHVECVARLERADRSE